MHLQPRWPDLLPDLLRSISGRLHHAIDFVRFHAVCRPWRASRDATATTQPFLPWLLSTTRTKPFRFLFEGLDQDELPNMKNDEPHRLTCVFSKTSYPAPPLPDMPNWVADADGTAFWYLGDHPYSSLHNFLTGATSLVQTIPDAKDDMFNRPRGVVYRDGTILMYNKLYSLGDDRENETRFWAALLRPGEDASWTVVERTLEASQYGKFCVAYQGGKILVSVGPNQWHSLSLNDELSSDILIPNPWTPAQREEYFYQSGHIMESRGEFLWVSLHILENFRDRSREGICNLVRALSLSVYALEEEMSAPKKMRWVKKDSQSLADRVMFLGWENSFAIDASRLGCDGGCAYFIYCDGENHRLHEWCAVFRCNLKDNSFELVEWLPKGWISSNCVWLIPQPTIAPVHACTMQL